MGVNSAYVAESVREEWRARNRLVNLASSSSSYPIHDLVDEDTTTATSAATSKKQQQQQRQQQAADIVVSPPEWKLQDILEEKENAAILPVKTSSTTTDPTATTGLRQRKPNKEGDSATKDNKYKGEETQEETSWTIVQEEGEDLDSDQESSLLRKDPIEFFGGWMPPRDLKLAQEKARQTMEGYVQAANHAAALLAALNATQP